jgi:hypothetical protein
MPNHSILPDDLYFTFRSNRLNLITRRDSMAPNDYKSTRAGSLIGVCGDNCAECPRFIATKNGSTRHLRDIAALWKRLGWRNADTTWDELACGGCGRSNACANSMLRDCAFEKDFDTCGQCRDYPCDRTEAVFEKNDKMVPEIRRLCTHGEYERLKKAFFLKKRNLDTVHKKAFSNRKKVKDQRKKGQ